MARARSGRKINNFCNEIVEPENVKQTEQGVSHRLQRLVVPKARKELSPEHREQEEKEDGNFEIIGMRRPDSRKIIKTASEHHGTANHPGNFEIRQALVIEHSIKFQEPDHSEHAYQEPKQDLVT